MSSIYFSGERRCLRCRGCETGGSCSHTPPTSILGLSPAASTSVSPPSTPSTASTPSTTSTSSNSTCTINNNNSTTNNNNNITTSSLSMTNSLLSLGSLNGSPLSSSPLGGLSAFSIPKSTPKSLTFASRDSSFQPVKPSSTRSSEAKVWRPY